MFKEGHNLAELNASELKEAVFKLSHFDPSCKDEYGNQVIDYLVLDALATFGLLKVTWVDIGQNIKKCFSLDFEEPEINAAGKRLDEKGMIKFVDAQREERPKFQIVPEIKIRIDKNLTHTRQVENEVIESWKEELCKKYKDYPIIKGNLQQIAENLMLFTTRMFMRHGVECVALLYPEAQKTQQWLAGVGSSILEGLPRIDYFTDAIVMLEIPSFFKNPEPKRKAYITGLFNSSFFWHLIHVDEKCSKLLRKVTRGQKLYIDNNILYSLVGLDGTTMLRSVHSMLRSAGALGYELWVTTKTVDEFHNSLKWQMKELRRRPPVPAELARIALENLDQDSFLTLYWRDLVNHGTTIEEFVAERSHLEDILEGLKIQTTNEFREEIEGSEELTEEERILRSVCIGDVHEEIIEHDAFHRIFIEKVRGRPRYFFSDAAAWFVTHDSKLPTFDRVARRGRSRLPFCITSDQWVQMNRPLLTRTSNEKEYEESFHVLVTQPFLRTMMSTFSLDKAYQEVLGRLARYKNMNPQTALNLVTDKHFMVIMALETEEQKIEEHIENKLVDLTNQLQSKKESLQKETEIKQGTIERLENKMEILTRAVEEIRDKSRVEKKKLEGNLEEERIQANEAQKETIRIKDEFRGFKSKLVRWAIFALALSFSSAFLWLHYLWFDWPWLANHQNVIVIKLASQLLLISAFMNIPLKQHWKMWLGLIGPCALAILRFACW